MAERSWNISYTRRVTADDLVEYLGDRELWFCKSSGASINIFDACPEALFDCCDVVTIVDNWLYLRVRSDKWDHVWDPMDIITSYQKEAPDMAIKFQLSPAEFLHLPDPEGDFSYVLEPYGHVTLADVPSSP